MLTVTMTMQDNPPLRAQTSTNEYGVSCRHPPLVRYGKILLVVSQLQEVNRHATTTRPGEHVWMAVTGLESGRHISEIMANASTKEKGCIVK